MKGRLGCHEGTGRDGQCRMESMRRNRVQARKGCVRTKRKDWTAWGNTVETEGNYSIILNNGNTKLKGRRISLNSYKIRVTTGGQRGTRGDKRRVNERKTTYSEWGDD